MGDDCEFVPESQNDDFVSELIVTPSEVAGSTSHFKEATKTLKRKFVDSFDDVVVAPPVNPMKPVKIEKE